MKINKIFQTLLLAVLVFTVNKTLGQQRMQMPEGAYKWRSGKTSTTISFKSINNLISIPVELNNVKVDLVLDTGMPMMGTLLHSDKIAKELNLMYSGEARLGGAGGGTTPAKIASGVNMKIGDIEFSSQTVIVVEENSNLNNFLNHGVIGNELLTRFIVEIDYDAGTITLTEPSVYKKNKDYEKLDLTFKSNYPFLKCSVTLENGITIPLNMVLDIGAAHAFSLIVESKNGIVLPKKVIDVRLGRGLDSEITGSMGRIKSFKLGTKTFDNALVSFNTKRRLPFEEEGNLGSGIMRRFNQIYDYGHKRLYIKPNKYYNDPFEFNMAGIQTSKSEGIIKIDRVLPNSAGKEAGLETGDIISKVNGKDVYKIYNNEFKNIFEKENQVVELVIKRGDITKTISVKLRRII